VVAWRSGNAFHSINEVNVREVGLVYCDGCSRYVTSRLGQLSLPSFRGR